MSQKTQILNHMKAGRTITPLQALGLYSVYRLSAVIYDLRKQGYKITTKLNRINNRPYAEYKLHVK